ncbi:hypothetical protein [Rheinheimera sp. 1928-s]|uniref:hypothetical protein n=1 Tax=Rheinheimera sp. 1928-s TaxID=3033803 RepID=UPI00262D2739|nr:hypothetical protein [Rheinheimera sp. 1928-s]MDF3127410.1 hypothetical protein [Rheinheimera sp. 1928-s]
MKMMTRALIAAAALAIGLGMAVVVLDSELTAQNAVVDKQVIQLANKKLEVDGLTSEVKNLNDQAQAAVNEQLLVAGLNTEHQQSETQINEQHQAVMINSNELKVSEHDPTRTWANAALPDAAGQLLYQSSRSAHGHGDKDSNSAATVKLSAIGLRTAAL